MSKVEVIKQLRAAKAENNLYIHKSKMIVSDKNYLIFYNPINSIECPFCQWLYTDAQKLRNLRNNSEEHMDSLEEIHEEIHNKYFNLFKLCNIKDIGFIGKLIGKEDSSIGAEAIDCYMKIEELSEKLSEKLTQLEKRVSVLKDSEIISLN